VLQSGVLFQLRGVRVRVCVFSSECVLVCVLSVSFLCFTQRLPLRFACTNRTNLTIDTQHRNLF
jgi:hypothetical protein